MQHLSQLIGALCTEQKPVSIKDLLFQIQNYFLEADGHSVRLTVSSEDPIDGIESVVFHIKSDFQNFDAEITQLDVEPAEGVDLQTIIDGVQADSQAVAVSTITDNDGKECLRFSPKC